MTDAQLHRGDALALLPTFPVGAADVVIADPPYNSGGRTPSERRTQSARDKYVSSDAKHSLADFAGDNRDQRSYGYWLSLILAECYRITGPGGIACVFTDWRQLPSTTDALQAAGWVWRGVITWQKPNNRPRRGGFRQSTEYIVWGTHGALLAERNPVCLPGLLTGSQPSGGTRVHITQKPVAVMRELVKVCPPGGTVLDPFTGSGSTGEAAIAEGRRFIGIEQTEHYHNIAANRLGLPRTP